MDQGRLPRDRIRGGGVSKIDDQLAHSVYCGVWEAHHNDDGELQSGPCSCDLEAARTELAALRRRAEDAEMMLRAFASGDWLLDESEEGMFLWQPDDGIHIRIDKDASGLPIITDEAREALK